MLLLVKIFQNSLTDGLQNYPEKLKILTETILRLITCKTEEHFSLILLTSQALSHYKMDLQVFP